MKIEFDPEKNNKNIIERNLNFERAKDFDFKTAIFKIDNRRDYGETRIIGWGFVGQRLHSMVFVKIEGGIRVISFRKANKREVKNYEIKSKRTIH